MGCACLCYSSGYQIFLFLLLTVTASDDTTGYACYKLNRKIPLKMVEKAEEKDLNLELSKILAKVMHCSYKRHECQEIMERVLEKIQKRNSHGVDLERLRSIRRRFEDVRKDYFGLH